VALAPLGFVMVMSFGVNRLSTAAMQGLFWAFSVVMGMSLSAIFFVYTGLRSR
jgi:FtsH-binding integral membrane protein